MRRDGFTLLEMMLALVLFATGTVAVMELLHRAQAGSTDGENVLIATLLAQRCQESLRNVSYANLTSQASSVCTVPVGAAFAPFSRTVTVTALASTPPYNTASLSRVDVQMTWTTQGTGGTANVTFSTLRSAH